MVTAFLATYNRLSTLERTVDSFRRFTTPYELVIIDNGTTDTDCLDLLTDIRRRDDVTRVYTMPKVATMQQLTNHFNFAMNDYRKSLRSLDGHHFAVTDSDLSFESTHPSALEAYLEVAHQTGGAAGPHTRVTDIPTGYPLRSRVLACESRLLYRKTMNWQGKIPYSAWQIDTTFHLFPASRRFRRLHMNTWRVGPPYDAMHLDWYVDVHAPTHENWVYLAEQRRPGVGSWGSDWLRAYWTVFQNHGPEAAFRALDAEPRCATDLCNVSFMLSWCHQYGVGTRVNIAASKRDLDRAVPQNGVWRKHRFDYGRMIFDSNFKDLGWAA